MMMKGEKGFQPSPLLCYIFCKRWLMPENLDQFNRGITYLRVSVTDRCNLQCTYCRPVKAFTPLGHNDILSYEEILRAIQAAARLGIKKVRLTGGEPLLRRGFPALVSSVCSEVDLEDVSITTNGVFLSKLARTLYLAGLRRINVSLDTLRRSRYVEITGRDHFEAVWKGLQEAEAIGFAPIKLNVVVMNGINEDEIFDFAEMSREKPYHIRFIEYMPFGEANRTFDERFVSSDRIRALLETSGPLEELERVDMDGPAQRYRYEGAKGEIGLISPMSGHLCSSCNRLRMTADGRLRPCLFSDVEFDIKKVLRRAPNETDLKDLFLKAIAAKPRRRCDSGGETKAVRRPMSAIGG
jgi:cyclic pyranopterin phosphate synthase